METNPRSIESTNHVLSSDDNGSALGTFPQNPFVGLRPYRSNEGLLFFGRREQTLELLQQFQQSRFLAVVGSSGCGKSSLIRAGLIPKLEAGFLVEQRDQWRIATAKPGDAPLQNLAESLVATFSDGSVDADLADLVDGMKTVCAQAVVDFLKTRLKESDANLLLLIDQFEELFTFGRYGQREVIDSDDTRSKEAQAAERLDRERRREEAADYVSIMLGLAQQCELPIYVVMTMRSDFLGDCDVFYGLPEAINVSQYLVPRLARPQRQEAIESPILLYGQTISQRLLDRILNDAGEEADQLPVMQHAMMRTWQKWKASGDPTLDLPHYEAAGGMKQALSDDAEEALAGMSREDVTITKKLFQALTDTDPRGRRVRRPTHLRDIEAITNASREKVLEIISHFSGHGRSFLHLSQEQSDPLVDISHESLIRQWGTLREWVAKESRSKDLYLRLVGTAVRYYKPQPEDDLLRGAALSFALEWRDKRKPNQAWANRYHPALDLALKFLEESKVQRDRDLAEAESHRNALLENERRNAENAQLLAEAKAEAQKKELDQALQLAAQREAAARWQRRAIYGLGFLLILAVATTVYAVRAGFKAKQQKDHAEEAERVAAGLSRQLEANVVELKDRVENQRILEQQLRVNLAEAKQLRFKADKLKDQAETQARIAKQQAARAQREVIAANRARASEQQALVDAKNANLLADQKTAEAVQERAKALANQSANQTFREGLALARINNPTAAAKKYNEALDAYKYLIEPDPEAEAITLLELADMYLRAEDEKLFEKGVVSLEKAEDVFQGIETTKPVQSNNGKAAVLIKMRDYVVSDRLLNLASPEGAAEYRQYSAYLFQEAYDFYEKAKNAEGLAFAADQLAEASRTSSEAEFASVLVSMYENLLKYYPEKEQAAERVALHLKIARMHMRLKETAAVNTDFENALKVYRAFDDKEAKEGEARTYVDIGFVSGADVDIHKNVELALHTVRPLKDPAAEANTLRYVCKKYQQTWSKGSAPRPGFASETAQAADYCSRALELYRSVPESRIQQAETLTDLGTINAANKPVAIENFQAAFNLYKDDERAERAALMLDIAAIQEEMGQLDQALKSFEAAKSILDKLDVMLDTLKAMRGVERVKAALEKHSARP